MNVLIGLAMALAAVVLLVAAAGQLGLLRGRSPAHLGVHDGRLKPPSYKPNSVSSQADLHPGHPMRQRARIAPLPAADGASASIARVRAAVEGLPGARVIEQRDDYLYVQFETRALHFIDDAEFWYDPAAQAIQVRSASRVGRTDFDVNRKRIEVIRAKLSTPAAA